MSEIAPHLETLNNGLGTILAAGIALCFLVSILLIADSLTQNQYDDLDFSSTVTKIIISVGGVAIITAIYKGYGISVITNFFN